MDQNALYGVEKLIAKPDKLAELKSMLQMAAERTRQVPGIRQLELFQNRGEPSEFVFFLVIDDLQAIEALNQAEWHQELEKVLPELIAGAPERIFGHRIA